ncbi:MAG: PrsW family intramembrane metalloprotease [Anaerolineae bacterium]
MSPTAVLFISIIAAAIPALFYVALIYWVDRYEKEPLWLLITAFFWGAIPSILIAFIFNTLFSLPIYLLAGDVTGDALAATLIAPPVEESIKGLMVLGIFFLWRHEIDSPLDGIIYGAMVGMGFAMVENVYYFVNVFGEGGLEAWGMNVFIRAVIFGLNHALFTGVTGLGVALARMTPNQVARLVLPIAGWVTAMFLHFLHNASVSFSSALCFLALLSDWGGVFLVILIIVWALWQERQWLRKYLAEEVQLGTLTVSQYKLAVSGRQRSRTLFHTLTSQGLGAYGRNRRFFQRCSELAYKKHHLTLFATKKNRLLVDKAREALLDMVNI